MSCKRTATANMTRRLKSMPECSSAKDVPRVSFVRAAARLCCCFRETKWSSVKILFAICTNRTSKADSAWDSTNRWSRPTFAFVRHLRDGHQGPEAKSDDHSGTLADSGNASDVQIEQRRMGRHQHHVLWFLLCDGR